MLPSYSFAGFFVSRHLGLLLCNIGKKEEAILKQYIMGILTGASLIACIFMFMAAGHTHDATEIEYSSSQYGAYGTLQKKLKQLDNYKAEEDHSHYEYDEKGHTHYEYAESLHWH